METSVPVGDKAKRCTHFDLQLHRSRGALRARLLLAADQCEQTHDEAQQQQIAREGRGAAKSSCPVYRQAATPTIFPRPTLQTAHSPPWKGTVGAFSDRAPWSWPWAES